MITICGTGHRPPKLGGYSDAVYRRLIDLALVALEHYNPDVVISGMALGWDQALADASIYMGIKTIGAIPCKGQHKRWPLKSQERYIAMVKKLSEYHVLSETYTPSCMQDRNIWMVDHSDAVLAIWDGSTGGTKNCIDYAVSERKPIYNLYQDWRELCHFG